MNYGDGNDGLKKDIRLYFGLLHFCGIGPGGALQLTAKPDDARGLATKTRLLKEVCITAAELTGIAIHLEWVPWARAMGSRPAAEAVAHAS